jgi:hypothetical protein
MHASLALLAAGLFLAHSALSSSRGKRSNIVFILSDDQDLEMGSIDYMPLLGKYLRAKGTTYERHYCTTALCCPARASILTGKMAHNHNVTDVVMPFGKCSSLGRAARRLIVRKVVIPRSSKRVLMTTTFLSGYKKPDGTRTMLESCGTPTVPTTTIDLGLGVGTGV